MNVIKSTWISPGMSGLRKILFTPGRWKNQADCMSNGIFVGLDTISPKISPASTLVSKLWFHNIVFNLRIGISCAEIYCFDYIHVYINTSEKCISNVKIILIFCSDMFNERPEGTVSYLIIISCWDSKLQFMQTTLVKSFEKWRNQRTK